MKWLLGFLVGVLGAVLGGVAAGWIASLCTVWYRISGFEGGAGYYVVFLALGGAIAGFVIGAGTGTVLLLKGKGLPAAVGIPLGTIVALAVAVLALAWLFGDVPPKLRGDELYVDVEVMCPTGWEPSNRVRSNRNSLALSSIGMQGEYRNSTSTWMDWDKTRLESGRRIFTGKVFLYTSTGRRELAVSLGDQEAARYPMPLPGHPTAENERWSEWLPNGPEANEANGFRYRFRVVRETDYGAREKAAKAEEIGKRRRKFESLGKNAPAAEWLSLLDYRYASMDKAGPDINEAARQVLADREEEVAALASQDDDLAATQALAALQALTPLTEDAERKVAEALQPIQKKVADGCASYNAEDPDTRGESLLKARFTTWSNTWEGLLRNRRIPDPPELGTLAALKPSCPANTEFWAISDLARYYSDEWKANAEAAPPSQ